MVRLYCEVVNNNSSFDTDFVSTSSVLSTVLGAGYTEGDRMKSCRLTGAVITGAAGAGYHANT